MPEVSTEGSGKLRASCPICLDTHPLDRLRALPCGHTFCVNDTERLFPTMHNRPTRARASGKCPLCKKTFTIDQAIRVFLDIPSADHDGRAGAPSSSHQSAEAVPLDMPGYTREVHKQARHVAEHVYKITPEVSKHTIQRTGKELMKVYEGMDKHPGDGVRLLLKTVSSLLSTTVATIAEDSARRRELLKSKDEEIDAMHARQLSLQEENERGQELFDQAEQAAHTAIDKSKNMETQVEELGKQNDGLKKRCLGMEETIQTLNRKKTRLEKSEETLRKKLAEAESLAADYKEQLERHLEAEKERRRAEYGSSQNDYYPPDVDLDDLESKLDTDFVESNSTAESIASQARTAKFETFPVVRTTSRPKFGDPWNVQTGTLGKRRRTDDGGLGMGSRSGKSTGQGRQEKASSEGNKLLAPLKMDGKGHVLGLVHTGPRLKLTKHN